jgi:hypothetical protein
MRKGKMQYIVNELTRRIQWKELPF